MLSDTEGLRGLMGGTGLKKKTLIPFILVHEAKTHGKFEGDMLPYASDWHCNKWPWVLAPLRAMTTKCGALSERDI